MASFTLKSGLSAAFLPGVGRVTVGMVLVGEQYRKFSPALLVETVEVKTVAAVEARPVSTAPMITEVRPLAPKPVVAAPITPQATVLTEVRPEVAPILTETPEASVAPVAKDAKISNKFKRK